MDFTRSNSMSRFVERGFLRFVLLAASFIAIPAFAQFEIAPDHFDGSEQKPMVQKSTTAKKAKIAQPAAPRPATQAVVSPGGTTRARRNGSTHTPQIARQLKPTGAGTAK
jgi:hypothetical protein